MLCISVLSDLLRLVYGLTWSIVECSRCESLFFWVHCCTAIPWSDWLVLTVSSVSLFIFCLVILSIMADEVLKPPTVVEFSLFPSNSGRFCHMCFGSLLLGFQWSEPLSIIGGPSLSL